MTPAGGSLMGQLTPKISEASPTWLEIIQQLPHHPALRRSFTLATFLLTFML